MHAPVSIHRILVYEVVWKASHGSLVRAWVCSFLVFLKVKCLPKTMFSRKQRIHGMILLRSCAQNNALSRWRILGTVWLERWCWWSLNDPWNIGRSDDRENMKKQSSRVLSRQNRGASTQLHSADNLRRGQVRKPQCGWTTYPSVPPPKKKGCWHGNRACTCKNSTCLRIQWTHSHWPSMEHVCKFHERYHTHPTHPISSVASSMCASSMNAITPTPPTLWTCCILHVRFPVP